MKIIVIDGQGGRIGSLLIEKIKNKLKTSAAQAEVIAIGTNSIATASMLRAGADAGATGENPVIVNCCDADYILGPIGIIAANSLLGEVTPPMAAAVASSAAKKLLLPVNKCSLHIVGMQEKDINELTMEAVTLITNEIKVCK